MDVSSSNTPPPIKRRGAKILIHLCRGNKWHVPVRSFVCVFVVDEPVSVCVCSCGCACTTTLDYSRDELKSLGKLCAISIYRPLETPSSRRHTTTPPPPPRTDTQTHACATGPLHLHDWFV